MAKSPWRRRRSAPDDVPATGSGSRPVTEPDAGPRAATGPATAGTRSTTTTDSALGATLTPAATSPASSTSSPAISSPSTATSSPSSPASRTAATTTTTATTTAAVDAAPAAEKTASAPPRRRRLLDATPLLLLRAAHPKQAVLTALGLAVAAALSNRPTREVGLVFVTVLVGQAVLGWHNDLVDRRRDAQYDVPGKPLADGRLDPGTAWFALACGVLLVVPLAVTNGLVAGAAYLLSLLVGLVGNLVLRRGLLSFLPWAVAFALYPAFLSYGGWGGAAEGDPPSVLMTALAALLGVGVHLLTALWGLVADNKEGWTYLPLRLGLRLGASRLLTVALVYVGLVLVAMAFAGTYVGLAR